MPGYVVTYVVEDPITHNITDMFSFQVRDSSNDKKDAIITSVVVTSSPARQLIADLIACAKLEKVDVIYTTQHGLSRSTFENLFIESDLQKYLHIYNYAYPEIDEEECCFFSF